MAQIEDQEMRQLFRTECEERLQKLDAGWLQLEKEPTNAVLIEDLFREAHSVKGAARMLGLLDIQDMAHGMEDELGAIRKGGVAITETLVQRQLKTLDQLRQLVAAAVGQEAAPQAASSTSALPPVKEAQTAPGTVPGPAPISIPLEPLAPQRSEPTSVPSISQANSTEKETNFKIETVRVGADRLDFLLSQTGELVVCRNHIQRLNNGLADLLSLASLGQQVPQQVLDQLNVLSSKFSEDTARLSLVTAEIETGIRNLRLLPASTLLDQFPRMVHDLALDLGKKIDLKLVGGDIVVDKRIIEEMKAPLMHLLRNAVDHGLEAPVGRHDAGKPEMGKLTVRVYQESDRVYIDVRDDGRGLDLEAVRALVVKKGLYSKDDAAQLDKGQLHMLILEQGFSTNKMITDVSGRGVGLNVVRTTVERLHGTLSIDSTPGKGMWITMGLPVSLISTRVLLVSDVGQVFAIPFENVVMLRKLAAQDVRWVEGRQCVDANGEIVFLNKLSHLLNLPMQSKGLVDVPYCMVLSDGQSRIGVLVDELLSEQEVVIKPTPMPVQKSMHLLGVTILDSGVISPVLNVRGLTRQVLEQGVKFTKSNTVVGTQKKSKLILLAEDSITTRIQEKRILEGAGYEVIATVDGFDAWSQLSRYKFDAVVSDIMMPNMTGLELTQKIRASQSFSTLPVILITTLSSEDDRRRGLEAGADAYLSKPEFDQTILLECLERLL
jgi:two-component system chemotaxis sensor kinase CheA